MTGSGLWVTAVLSNEATLEREHRFNIWLIERSASLENQDCVFFSVTVTLGIQSNLLNTVKFQQI